MKRQRWQLMAVTFALASLGSISRPMPAQAQGAPLGKPVPRNTNLVDAPPAVGRFISLLDHSSGLVAVALITGTGTDNKGNTLEWEAQVRTFQGLFLDQVGAPARKTFVTTKLDVFSGSGANRTQIHALHMPFHGPPSVTSITDPLFGAEWTGPVPEESIKGNPFTAQMTLDVADAEHHDAFTLGGTQEYQDAMATLHVEWQPIGPPYTWNSPKAEGNFVGIYSLATARIDFAFTSVTSARDATEFTFKSNPAGQKLVFAQVGHEMQGLFIVPGFARTTPAQGPAPKAQGTPVPKLADIRFSWPGVGRFVSLVDNFTGIVGVAMLTGTGSDGQGNPLEWESELHLVQGVYIGADGAPARGTFLTTRLDVYRVSGTTRTQIHALHGIHHGPPNLTSTGDPLYGPDWTGPIPAESIKGNPFTSVMTLDAVDVPQHDAFFLGGVTENPDAKATLHVEWRPGLVGYSWSSPKQMIRVPGEEAEYLFTGFVGSYSLAQASMDFSFTSRATARDATAFTFKSNAAGQRLIFAQVGQEMNGALVAQ